MKQPSNVIRKHVKHTKLSLFGASIEDNTDSNYKRGWRQYMQLCDKLYNGDYTVSAQKINDYICARFNTDVDLGTVNNEINGIIHYNTAIFNTKINHDMLFKKLKTGYKKLRGHDLKIRASFNINQCLIIIKYLSNYTNNKFNNLTFKTAFIVAFWCMLRASEYCYNKNTKTQTFITNNSINQYLKHNKYYLKLIIRHPKTNKIGTQETITSCKCNTYGIGPNLCPYHAISDYIQRKILYIPEKYDTPTNAFFVVLNNKVTTGISPLRYDVWQSCIKSLYNILGISPDYLGTHCCRISGASHLFNSGVPAPIICALGRWKSESWKRYIRTSSEKLLFLCDSTIDDNNNPASINESIFNNHLSNNSLPQNVFTKTKDINSCQTQNKPNNNLSLF